MKSVGRKFVKVLLLPIALPILLVIRLINPWFVIRIGTLCGERIGHLAINTDIYLCERYAGYNVPNKNHIDLWYVSGKICNHQLVRMWKRRLIIGPVTLLSLIDRLNSIFPGHEIHKIPDESRDLNNLLDCTLTHLKFLPFEERKGQDGLCALGIPAGAPFVCLLVRDNAYLDQTYPEKNWDEYDFRDSTIGNYVLAAEELTMLGYYVVRIGAAVKEPFPCFHPMIIDYATNGMRNEFMDIYLSATCKFFVSTGTGIDAVALAFRKPYLFVNLVPLGFCDTSTQKHIFITKTYFIRSESRFMTFREIFESGADFFNSSKQFQENGIELVENTPEEIAAAVLEMEARLSGKWETTRENEELQKRFWEIFPTSAVHPDNGRPLHGEIRSRIGAEFLKQNRELLQ